MHGDWTLVERAVAGDSASFGQLYVRHVDELRRFVGTRLGDAHAVDDLVNETFVRAWRRLGSVRSDAHNSVLPWLRAIALNLLRDYWKHSSRREVLGIDGSADRVGHAVNICAPADPATVYAEKDRVAELVDTISSVLSDLTREQQLCLFARYWLELSPDETATMLHRSTAAVKMLQHRAQRAMRCALAVDRKP